MKKFLLLINGIVMLLLSAIPLLGQNIEITGQQVVSCPETKATVEVSVANFTDVQSAQFGVSWDTAIIKYCDFDSDLPSTVLAPDSSNAANGFYNFSWFDAVAPSGDYPPGGSAVIFTLEFEVKGNVGDSSLITIGDLPGFNLEIFLTDFTTLGVGDVDVINGEIEVDDVTPPIILSCPSDQTITVLSGQNSEIVTWSEPDTTDNCEMASLVSTHASGQSFPLGTTTVVYTATDFNSNTNDVPCEFDITIEQASSNPDALTFSALDTTLICDDSLFSVPVIVENFEDMTIVALGIVWDTSLIEYIDKTDSIGVNYPGTAVYNEMNAPNGSLIFSWIAQSSAGLGLNDSTTIFVLHFKAKNPSSLPSLIEITSLPGFALEFYNSSGQININDVVISNATIDKQTDMQPSIVGGCPNRVIFADADCSVPLPNYIDSLSFSDDCTPLSDLVFEQTPDSLSFLVDNNLSVSVTVTDEVGNDSICTFNVSFIDNVPPSLACPSSDVSVGTALGQCSGTAMWSVTYSDNCGVVSVDSSHVSGEVFSVGTTVVSYKVKDGVDSTECSFNVVVNDTEAPVLACPSSDIVFGTAMGSCDTTATWAVTYSDNCGITSVDSSHVSGEVFSVGTTVVSYKVKDGVDSTECSFNVVVNDTEAPVLACPSSDVVFGTAMGSCDTTATWAVTYSDNCGITSVDSSHASGSVFSVGTTTVSYKVKDGVDSTACSFNVVVTDAELPMIACPVNQTVSPDVNCDGVLVDYTTMLVSLSDNCSDSIDINLMQSPLPGIISFDTDVTIVATDESGNVDSCMFKVEIVGSTDPIANCFQDTTVYLDNMGAVMIDPTYVDSMSTGNCSTLSYSIDVSAFDCSDIGDNIVTLTVLDTNGGDSTCMTIVHVLDTIPPMIVSCQSDTFLIADSNCQAVLPDFTGAISFEDNCTDVGDLKITQTPPDGTIITSDTTIAVIALDSVGVISDTCFFVVELRDTVPPTINCPADTIVNTMIDSCGAMVSWNSSIGDDNCNIDSLYCIPASGSYFQTGSTTVACTIMDRSGNLDSCTFIVTVNDSIPPYLDCPSDTLITVNMAIADTMIFNLALDSLSDNCSVDTVYYQLAGATVGSGADDVSGVAFEMGTTIVTYYAQDTTGNIDSCSFNVVVIQPQDIDITCPSDYSLSADTLECSAVLNTDVPIVTSTGMIDTIYYELTGVTSGSGPDSLSDTQIFNVGETIVTYTAVTVANDTATCSFKVDVSDDEMPVITCPAASVFVDNELDSCGTFFINSMQMASATDNCPSVQLDYDVVIGDFIGVGTNTITATATDQSDNTLSCEYKIIVRDTQPPLIIDCPDNIMVNNDLNDCGAIVTWTAPTVEDNCGVLLLESTPYEPGEFIPVGSEFITYTASDLAGNVSECVFSVTVRDDEAPELNPCPDSIIVDSEPGFCSAVVSWPFIQPTDNCSVVSFVLTPQSGATFQVGTTMVQAVATDAAGNVTVCQFEVTVEDKEFPTMNNFPNNMVIDNDPGECGAIVTWGTIGTDDNCEVDTFYCDAASGDMFPIGMTEVECTVIDVNGNAVTDDFTITVIDNENPQVTCPDNALVNVDGTIISDPSGFISNVQPMNCDSAIVTYNSLITTDNCTIPIVTQSTGPASGSTLSAGLYSLTFDIEDLSANSVSCSFTIEVEGKQVADASVSDDGPCEGDDVVFSVQNFTGATYEWRDPLGNIISDQFSFTQPSLTVDMSGVYTVKVDFPFGCSLTADVNVTVSPSPILGVIHSDLLCAMAGTPLMLEAFDDANTGITDYVWSTPQGATFFGNPINVNNPMEGTYSLSVTNASGCTATSSIFIEITAQPETPDLTGPFSACLGEEFDLDGEEFSGMGIEYHWAANLPSAGISDANNHDNSAMPTAPGVYTYYYYVTQGDCISDSAEWIVEVEAFPSFDLGTTGEENCVDGTSSIVIESMPTTSDFSWSISGPCSPAQTDSMFVFNNVNSDCSGTYLITATSALGCDSTKSVSLDITDKPVLPNIQATSDTICMGGATTLFLTNIPLGANLLCYENGMQTACTIGDPIQPTDNVEYGVQYSVDGCLSDTAFLNVFVEAPLDVPININGEISCVDGTGMVTLSTSAMGVIYEWDGPCGVQVGSILEIPNITAACSGLYSVSVTGMLGQCISIGTLQLEVTDMMDAITVVQNGPACEDGDVSLCVEPEIIGASYTWMDPFGNMISDERCLTTMAIPSIDPYTVTAERGGCTTTGELVVDVLVAPDAIDETVVGLVNAAQSFNVVANDILSSDQYSISVIQQPNSGIVSYNGEGVFTYTPEEDFRETDVMAYEICYDECPDLCDIAIVTILVRYPIDQCIATTVITPNNDGINDDFVVSCLELGGCPNNQLFIFNQWGDQVFEAAPYDNTWKGTYNDKDLPDGTYYYIFKCDETTEAEKGFVVIHR